LITATCNAADLEKQIVPGCKPLKFQEASMKSICALLLIFLLPAFLAAQAKPARRPPPLVFTHVSVVDVANGNLLLNQTVVVVGKRIAAVGPSGSLRIPRGSRVIKASRQYLMPGLWDAHAHLSYAGDCALSVLLAHGVTSVRDLGGSLRDVRVWQRRIAAGETLGPRIKVAGPNIESARWLALVAKLLESTEDLKHYRPFDSSSPRLSVGNPQQAREAVTTLTRLGVDIVKFRNLGGEDFRTLAAEAKRQGMLLVAHAPSDVSLAEASDAGMASFEHGETVSNRLVGVSEQNRAEQFARLARNNTMITPTLIADYRSKLSTDEEMRTAISDATGSLDSRNAYVSRQLREKWQFAYDTRRFNGGQDWAAFFRRSAEDLRAAYRAGVQMMVGTDLGVIGVYPGSSVHEEMALMIGQIGMRPAEVLRAATLNPARFFGMERSLGTVEPGKLSDLVLLDADPLADIRATQRISGVVLAGHYLDRVMLDALLSKARTATRTQASCVN
jgi:imidazolonepropionase-like amidohydrolase